MLVRLVQTSVCNRRGAAPVQGSRPFRRYGARGWRGAAGAAGPGSAWTGAGCQRRLAAAPAHADRLRRARLARDRRVRRRQALGRPPGVRRAGARRRPGRRLDPRATGRDARRRARRRRRVPTARTIDDFAQFAEPALANPALDAVSWAPRVTAPMRSAFESERGFTISEQADGVARPPSEPRTTPPPSSRRPRRTPARSASTWPPIRRRRRRQGGDRGRHGTCHGAGPDRRRRCRAGPAAFQRGAARDDARRARRCPTGIAVGTSSRTRSPRRCAASAACTCGIIDGSPRRSTRSATPPRPAASPDRSTPAGRSWQVAVESATSPGGQALPWVVLVAGLLAAVLIALMAEQASRRLTFAEDLVAQRTIELREALALLHTANAEAVAARADAERKSQVDALTDTYNRGHLIELLKVELNAGRTRRRDAGGAAGRRRRLPLAERGVRATAGDIVLVEIATRLKAMLRSVRLARPLRRQALRGAGADRAVRRGAVPASPTPSAEVRSAPAWFRSRAASCGRPLGRRCPATAPIDPFAAAPRPPTRRSPLAHQRGRYTHRRSPATRWRRSCGAEPDAIRIAQALARCRRPVAKERPSITTGRSPSRPRRWPRPLGLTNERAAGAARRLAARRRQGRSSRRRILRSREKAERGGVGDPCAATPRSAGDRTRIADLALAGPPFATTTSGSTAPATWMPLAGEEDPARGPHRRRRRRLLGDDGLPALPPLARHGRRAPRAEALGRACTSTRPSSRPALSSRPTPTAPATSAPARRPARASKSHLARAPRRVPGV